MCRYYFKGISFRPFLKPDSNANVYGSLIGDSLLRFHVLTCINGVAAALPINNSLKAHFCTAPSTWHARYTGWHLRLVSPSSAGRGARLLRRRRRRQRQREAVNKKPAPLRCEHEAGRNQRSPLPREPNAKTSDSGGPLGPAGVFFFFCAVIQGWRVSTARTIFQSSESQHTLSSDCANPWAAVRIPSPDSVLLFCAHMVWIRRRSSCTVHCRPIGGLECSSVRDKDVKSGPGVFQPLPKVFRRQSCRPAACDPLERRAPLWRRWPSSWLLLSRYSFCEWHEEMLFIWIFFLFLYLKRSGFYICVFFCFFF